MNRLLLIAGVACALALSCKKETPSLQQEGNETELTFTAGGVFSAEVTTKTSTVESLSNSGFYVSATTGDAGSETSYWTSTKFTKTSSDNTKYSASKYWPATNPGLHFYASNITNTFNAQGATVSATNDTDVVCAYLPTPSFKTVNQLQFNHIFARIGMCYLTVPTGYTGGTLTATLVPKTGGTYNLRTGLWPTVTTASSPATIASSFKSESACDLYVVPGSYDITVTYTLSKGDYQDSFTKTATVVLQAGKINSINATVPEGEATDIKFSVSIQPWTNNNITSVEFQ